MNNQLLITETDVSRIERLLNELPDDVFPGKHELENELTRATIVDSTEIPDTVVTMNSVIRFRLQPTGKEFRLRLVYPKDASSGDDCISVIAPVGSALLGLSVGDTIDWSGPGGGQLRVTIIDVEYQPERAGQYHM